ncbi:MAG: formate dehydrogenase accessory sulfurtransferase FdhD [Alsobacter sp.]
MSEADTAHRDDEDEIRILDAPPPPVQEQDSLFVRRAGPPERRTRQIATEVPVAVTYNGVAYAVMMASPIDIEDFVTGFSLTEEVVQSATEIEEIVVRPIELGLLAQARIPAARGRGLTEHRRTLVGQTGCGICGVMELEQAVRRYGGNKTRPRIDRDAVFAAWDALSPRQALNARTGAVHAAAFADEEGRLIAVREDVGRHNALDKLIGALARNGVDTAQGFCLMTSRISFELVQKCLASGLPALVGISAPTSLAIRLARENGLTLLALARSDGFQVFSDPYGLFETLTG